MPRYQHGAVFVNARLHISGGAVGGGRMVEDKDSVVTLDTSAGSWVHQEAPEEQDDWAGRAVSQYAAGQPVMRLLQPTKMTNVLTRAPIFPCQCGALFFINVGGCL